jgi:hypothetical protein
MNKSREVEVKAKVKVKAEVKSKGDQPFTKYDFSVLSSVKGIVLCILEFLRYTSNSEARNCPESPHVKPFNQVTELGVILPLEM